MKRTFFRSKMYERDKGLCGICGEPVEYWDVDLDHIVPTSAGGLYHWENLRISHSACNRRRGDERRHERRQQQPADTYGLVRSEKDGFVILSLASEQVGLSPERLRQLIVAGDLKGERQGRFWFVRESEVKRLKTEPRPKPGPRGPRRRPGRPRST